MILNLENGYTVNFDFKSNHNIFYGPNKIGKTQISKKLKEYYEQKSENVLLFSDNILNDMIIQENNDTNSFEVMPMAQEYNKYSKALEINKQNLIVKDNLKELCSINTKKAFTDFDRITKYINDNVYDNVDNSLFPYYEEEEIKEMLNPKKIQFNIWVK